MATNKQITEREIIDRATRIKRKLFWIAQNIKDEEDIRKLRAKCFYLIRTITSLAEHLTKRDLKDLRR